MERRLLLVAALAVFHGAQAQIDIEGLTVETYYISDANDATDTIGGGLVEGSRTYRVFLDLCTDCSLRAIYGSADHTLRIVSTAPFFNNLDRGRRYGHEMSNNGLRENTVALDSWLSMGGASTQRLGILKADDPDGAGTLFPNDGGSELIPGGLLSNDDPDAGIPLTQADGLVPLTGGSATPPGFNWVGDDPGAVLFDSTLGSAFVTNNFTMLCLAPGIKGPTPDNRILIAQLTTTGTLTLELNVEVQRPDGTLIRYVADGTVLLVGEVQSGFLTYPPQCGCTDPNFLEFDPAASCDDGSCATSIVFGCLDTTACNYSTNANFNVPELCCYGPGNCNGLDVTIVCPDVGAADADGAAFTWQVHPNPADELLTILFNGGMDQRMSWALYDCSGRSVISGDVPSGTVRALVDMSMLSPGMYQLRLQRGTRYYHRPVIKT